MSDGPHRPLPDASLGLGAPPAWRRFVTEPRLLQCAMVLLLLLPLALFYARAIADIFVSLIALMFLARSWLLRDHAWLRPTHVRLALVFWLWLVFCSLLDGTPRSIGEAVALIRLFLFAAALEFWLLTEPRHRRQLRYVVLATVAWLIIESWQQYLFGTNIFGIPRWDSGVLTGPFNRPRAAAALQMLYFVAFLPPAMHLLDRPGLWRRLASALLLAASALCLAIIGQRMPMLLTLFGLCIAALIAPRFRWAIAIALLAVVAAIAATQIISPMTYHTLVVVFLRRMEHFWATPYGAIYQRAAVMVQYHPWLGLGFDGYRDYCNDPAYIKLVAWLPAADIHDPIACTIHPHNYWLQIATSAGLPGVALFLVLSIAWLTRMGRGMYGGERPMQVALFVTLCTIVWPIASTTDLFTLPNAGWVFLLIGWGLAESGPAAAPPQTLG